LLGDHRFKELNALTSTSLNPTKLLLSLFFSGCFEFLNTICPGPTQKIWIKRGKEKIFQQLHESPEAGVLLYYHLSVVTLCPNHEVTMTFLPDMQLHLNLCHNIIKLVLRFELYVDIKFS
jgi:hypothetical protein